MGKIEENYSYSHIYYSLAVISIKNFKMVAGTPLWKQKKKNFSQTQPVEAEWFRILQQLKMNSAYTESSKILQLQLKNEEKVFGGEAKLDTKMSSKN